jgi:hypothetical protein
MNQDQIDSLVRTALKMISAVLTAHGAQQLATAVTAPSTIELAIGLVMGALSLYASHSTHSDPPVASSAPVAAAAADSTPASK